MEASIATTLLPEREQGRLFIRKGLFYAVLVYPFVDKPVEIVLHGISSMEDALQALRGFGLLAESLSMSQLQGAGSGVL